MVSETLVNQSPRELLGLTEPQLDLCLSVVHQMHKIRQLPPQQRDPWIVNLAETPGIPPHLTKEEWDLLHLYLQALTVQQAENLTH